MSVNTSAMEHHMPLQEFTVLAEAADSKPGAISRLAQIRLAAAVIGALLLGAAVTAAVLLFSFYICNQDAGAASSKVKLNVTCSVQKRDGQGRHHIFTVDRAATYLVYGWLVFLPATTKAEAADVVVLKQTLNRLENDLQTKPRASEVFFFKKVKMVDYSTVSVHFSGQLADSSFHIYEL